MPKSKNGSQYNSGLDCFCWMLGQQTLLAKIRVLRASLGVKNFYSYADLSKEQRRTLTAGTQFGLVRRFGRGFQFASETGLLKRLLKRNDISISQKQLVYATARPYRLGEAAPKHQPLTTNRMRDLSFAVSILGFSDNTGQQKMASRLGLCRQTVNEKCRNNRYLRTQQNWARITNLFGNQGVDQKKIQHFLGAHKINSYRIGKDGWLYRQLPNLYELKNIKLEFHDFKTFRFSNKVLNRYFFTGVAKSNSPCPANKFIAMQRAQRSTRSHLNAHGIRVVKNQLMTANQKIREHFEERTDRVELNRVNRRPNCPVNRVIEHRYRIIKTPYGRLSGELTLMNQYGVVRNHEQYERRVLKGTFNQISTRGLNRNLRDLRNPRSQSDYQKALRFLNNRNSYQSGIGREQTGAELYGNPMVG